ncbi:MAG: amidohydrolase family protein [Dehalobacterium sp.]
MLTITNAGLIDGTGAPLQNNIILIIDGKRLVAVGRDIPVPGGSAVIDAKGRFVIPGLIDAHVHLGGDSGLERVTLGGRVATYDYAYTRETLLANGITTIRSAGDFMPDIREVRELTKEGKMRGPRIFACGKMFQAPGGHPQYTVFGDLDAIRDNAIVLCETPQQAAEEVKRLAALGVEFIKAIFSNVNKMHYPDRVPRLSEEILQAIADAARSQGLPLMVHVENPTDMALAVKIGAYSIEHAFGIGADYAEMTDDILRLLVESGVYVVPTLVAVHNTDGGIPGFPLAEAYMMDIMRKMVQAGVKLGVGTDGSVPFVPYGQALHTEMKLFTEAGFSPMEALIAATAGNAGIIGQLENLGTLEAGKYADLVVLGSNPLDDIANTQDIKMVIQEGRIVVDNMLA